MKKIIVVMGASGSGKTNLIGEYLKSKGIPELVSHVWNRDIRKGEIDGITYYFLKTKEDWDNIEKAEWSEYSGAYYSLSKKEIEKKLGESDKVFVIMERRGIEQLLSLEEYKEMIEVIYVYSTPSECAQRMIKDRGYESAMKRLLNAYKDHEFENMDIADHIIRNKDGEEDLVLRKLDFILSQI